MTINTSKLYERVRVALNRRGVVIAPGATGTKYLAAVRELESLPKAFKPNTNRIAAELTEWLAKQPAPEPLQPHPYSIWTRQELTRSPAMRIAVERALRDIDRTRSIP